MLQLPRLAVGIVQPNTLTQPMVWALSEAFRRIGVRVQSFLSRAHFSQYAGRLESTGLSPRHLDSWLMSPDACRALFVYGTRSADLAVVEGQFRPVPEGGAGGQLEPLCQWLDLPRVIVLDVARLESCRLPEIPRDTAGLLLDGISDTNHFARLTTDLESVLHAPVLGALDAMPDLRAALAELPPGERIPAAFCRQLGDRFARWWNPGRILELATRRQMPAPDSSWLRGGKTRRCKLTVAIAYDEAFHCYFPDTLDLLELQGASVIDFSPLRDEHLPPQTDIAVFGCGRPEHYATTLSENHCMMAALRSHLCAGRRIYAEGGGAAYLCRQMETPWGEFKRMAAVVPAVARWLREPAPPTPAEVRLARPTWLGSTGTLLRGYRNSHWQFVPLDGSRTTLSDEADQYEILGDFQAIGSPIHLDFAADPCCLNHLFYPERVDLAQRYPFAVPSP